MSGIIQDLICPDTTRCINQVCALRDNCSRNLQRYIDKQYMNRNPNIERFDCSKEKDFKNYINEKHN